MNKFNFSRLTLGVLACVMIAQPVVQANPFVGWGLNAFGAAALATAATVATIGGTMIDKVTTYVHPVVTPVVTATPSFFSRTGSFVYSNGKAIGSAIVSPVINHPKTAAAIAATGVAIGTTYGLYKKFSKNSDVAVAQPKAIAPNKAKQLFTTKVTEFATAASYVEATAEALVKAAKAFNKQELTNAVQEFITLKKLYFKQKYNAQKNTILSQMKKQLDVIFEKLA